MKFSLFFIPLFLVTTSGLRFHRPASLIPLMKLMKAPISLLPLKKKLIEDPATLIANMYNTDPETVNSMRVLVEELIRDGVSGEEQLTYVRDVAQSLFDNQTHILAESEEDLIGAKSLLDDAQTYLESRASEEATNRRNMYEGLEDKAQKKRVLDNVIARESHEGPFLDDERSGYVELKAGLVSIKNQQDAESGVNQEEKSEIAKSQLTLFETNRHLLQTANDVDAETAISAVDDLIGYIDEKKSSLSAALAEARSGYNRADSVLKDRTQIYETSKANRDEAEREFNKVHANYQAAFGSKDTALHWKNIYWADLVIKQAKLVEKTKLFLIRHDELDEVLALLDNV